MVSIEYRTLARLGGDTGPRGEKGDPGPDGPRGERGLPGPTAVPSVEAVAAYARAGDSDVFAAIDETWAQKGEINPLIYGLVNGYQPAPRMVAYGHSYVAGQGLSASEYWVPRLAANMGLPLTNRAQGGTLAEDSAWRMWGNNTAGFDIGSKAVVVIQNMLNTLRLNGVDAPTWRGADWSLRTMCALASARAGYGVTSDRFTWSSSGWSSFATDNAFFGGGYRATNTAEGAGAYVEFVTDTDSGGTHLLTLARKVGLSPGLTEIRRMDTNAVLFLFENENQAAAGIAQNYAPAAFGLAVPRGTRVRVTNLAVGGGAGVSTIVGLLEHEPYNPNPVLLMKEPKLANWSASTMFPNGSDAAVDYFNQIIDTMAAARVNVTAVEPTPWWTKQNAAGLVLSDQVHPTAAGHYRLRTAAMTALGGKILRDEAARAAKTYDTGWVSLAAYLASGFTGVLQGRRVGEMISITGQISGSMASGQETVVVTDLPTTWRPITANASAGAYFGTPGADPGVVRILNSGAIRATQSSGAAKGTLHFSATFLAPSS